MTEFQIIIKRDVSQGNISVPCERNTVCVRRVLSISMLFCKVQPKLHCGVYRGRVNVGIFECVST